MPSANYGADRQTRIDAVSMTWEVLRQALLDAGVSEFRLLYNGRDSSTDEDETEYDLLEGREEGEWPNNLREQCETFINELLPSCYYEDLGGYGTVFLKVEANDILIDHYDRIETEENRTICPLLGET